MKLRGFDLVMTLDRVEADPEYGDRAYGKVIHDGNTFEVGGGTIDGQTWIEANVFEPGYLPLVRAVGLDVDDPNDKAEIEALDKWLVTAGRRLMQEACAMVSIKGRRNSGH